MINTCTELYAPHTLTSLFVSKSGDNFKWADWDCGATNDGPNLAFKPICQRDKLQEGSDRDSDDYYDYDYEEDEEEEDKNEDLVLPPNSNNCLVENAKITKPVSMFLH